jgi:hypothetical protein
MTQPAPEPAQAVAWAAERLTSSKEDPISQPRSAPADLTDSTEAPTRIEKPPPTQPPLKGRSSSPPPKELTIDAVPRLDAGLDKTSRDTQKGSRRSWWGLCILVVLAIGSVAGGVVAKSPVFWAFAGSICVGASAGLLALAARDLGIASETASFLRMLLPKQKSTSDGKDPDGHSGEVGPVSHRESAALRLARRLENDHGKDNELTEVAYRMAAQENDTPDALYWLGDRYAKERKYQDAKDELRKAKKKGSVDAAFLLGTLTPDSQYLQQDDIARTNLRILRLLAEALPDRIEFWQAYLISLLKEEGKDSARLAGAKAVEDYDGDPRLRLLQIRLDSPDYPHFNSFFEALKYSSKDIGAFPEAMHAELYFHAAVKLIYAGGPASNKLFYSEYWDLYQMDEDIKKSSDRYKEEFGASLRKYISEAGQFKHTLWLSQLAAVEAAYEYVLRNFDKAGALLESALESKPRVAGPLSFDDVQSLALILKSAGDNTVEPLSSALLRARRNLEGAVEYDIDNRQHLFRALIASMVPGVDIQAPIPGTKALGVDDISESLNSANSIPGHG